MPPTKTLLNQIHVGYRHAEDWAVHFFPKEEGSFSGVMVKYEPRIAGGVEFIPDGVASGHSECVWWENKPSEQLCELVRDFHLTKAVAPLIDKLLEEYEDLAEHIAGVLPEGVSNANA